MGGWKLHVNLDVEATDSNKYFWTLNTNSNASIDLNLNDLFTLDWNGTKKIKPKWSKTNIITNQRAWHNQSEWTKITASSY